MKKYTMEQIDAITEKMGWHSCIANNERNGIEEFGTDTIMIAEQEDDDYFGEFVGDEEEGYDFILYTED